MIRPPDQGGVAFTGSADGDMRDDLDARRRVSRALGIPEDWARVRQVHGASVLRVSKPGVAGDADALWTTEPGLPLAVLTADCFGVVLVADGAVGVAHAGWRGAEAGVVRLLARAMTDNGYEPRTACFGPGIGPCCFEVGVEVAERFPEDVSTTTWGTVSVDLPAALRRQADPIGPWIAGRCTRHEEGWFSHRRDSTEARLATLGWL